MRMACSTAAASKISWPLVSCMVEGPVKGEMEGLGGCAAIIEWALASHNICHCLSEKAFLLPPHYDEDAHSS